MLTFHNDPAIKERYVARVKAHRAADDIIRGKYGEVAGVSGWRGCAVGCTIHGDDHSAYERELGIPLWLAHVEDGIFESMTKSRCADWPLQFLEAIPIGVDLYSVLDKFMLYILADETDGVIRFATDNERPSIQSIIDLFAIRVAGEIIAKSDWDSAADAAYAAYAAADATYAADAARAAYAAARAAYAAADATYAAARAARAAYADATYATYATYAADAAADAADAAYAAYAARAADAADAADAAADVDADADAAAVRDRQADMLLELLRAS